MLLGTIVRYLDETLKTADFPQDTSLNGLQVEGSVRVRRAAFAVDACMESIRRAARIRADLLIVHHGLFWGDAVPITGIMAKRIGTLLKHSISLYACHLPLDCHPEIGNNIQLARLVRIREPKSFGLYKGHRIGLYGHLTRPVTVRSLAASLRKSLGAPVRTFAFGPERISKLGIVSGNGGFLMEEAARLGCDALLTGEPSYTAYHPAREGGVSLICSGHYATETVGLKALSEMVKQELDLPTHFIETPSEL
ncbi:MAG: Nif3-like dinuclear metal center hexameric protein [bacterium]|nr:MAG: Nif3-like dinuclear metal center hexameric protein [bacterium]